MKQGDVKTKVLRQNFIKKHQINPGYFTIQDHYDMENLEFCDRYLFHPKNTSITHNKHKQQNLITYRSSCHKKSFSIPNMTILSPDQKKIREYKRFKQKITPTNKQSLTRNPKMKMSLEPNLIKTDKIKNRKIGTNQAKNFLNLAVFIMTPCTVKPINLSPRPFSAAVHLKKQTLKTSRDMKHTVSQKKHRKKSILDPWQTYQNQF